MKNQKINIRWVVGKLSHITHVAISIGHIFRFRVYCPDSKHERFLGESIEVQRGRTRVNTYFTEEGVFTYLFVIS